MGIYTDNKSVSTLPVVPVYPVGGRVMERTIRGRMSFDPRPDRGDRYIMDQLVGARSRCKTRREWVKVRRDVMGSIDMLTYSTTRTLRRAK